MKYIFTLLVCSALQSITFAADQPPGQIVSPAVQDFLERVDEYVQLRQRILQELPPLTRDATPEEIVRHQQLLAARLMDARADAQQGDVLTPAASQALVAIVEHELRGEFGEEVRAAILETDPKIELRVNFLYPEDAVLSTVPPTLLMQLPPLPEPLQYRFSDWHLLLLDIHAHLIVDYLREKPAPINGRTQ